MDRAKRRMELGKEGTNESRQEETKELRKERRSCENRSKTKAILGRVYTRMSRKIRTWSVAFKPLFLLYVTLRWTIIRLRSF